MGNRPIGRDIDDLAVEVEGIAALALVLSGGFLEHETGGYINSVIGKCFYTLSNYANRISEDLMEISVDKSACISINTKKEA